MGGFHDNSNFPNPKVTGWTGSHGREFLKSMMEMLKCSSPQLMASGGSMVGKDLIVFIGGCQEVDRAPVSI